MREIWYERHEKIREFSPGVANSGGNGISVCVRWASDFSRRYLDLAHLNIQIYPTLGTAARSSNDKTTKLFVSDEKTGNASRIAVYRRHSRITPCTCISTRAGSPYLAIRGSKGSHGELEKWVARIANLMKVELSALFWRLDGANSIMPVTLPYRVAR